MCQWLTQVPYFPPEELPVHSMNTYAELTQPPSSMDVIEDFVDDRIYSSPYISHMQKNVDELRTQTTEYEVMVHDCLEAIKESKKTHTTEVKDIKKSLKTVKHELELLQNNPTLTAARPEPPSPKIREARLYGGAFLVWYFPVAITKFSHILE
ncbi:hypothetical protein EI94DRAFT_1700942 [Lactarius quietus]|nr:hypothetical protein EI94DRAFT_1700942 [Lactarius quietus]